jgi:hypothetical protein
MEVRTRDAQLVLYASSTANYATSAYWWPAQSLLTTFDAGAPLYVSVPGQVLAPANPDAGEKERDEEQLVPGVDLDHVGQRLEFLVYQAMSKALASVPTHPMAREIADVPIERGWAQPAGVWLLGNPRVVRKDMVARVGALIVEYTVRHHVAYAAMVKVVLASAGEGLKVMGTTHAIRLVSPYGVPVAERPPWGPELDTLAQAQWPQRARSDQIFLRPAMVPTVPLATVLTSDDETKPLAVQQVQVTPSTSGQWITMLASADRVAPLTMLELAQRARKLRERNKARAKREELKAEVTVKRARNEPTLLEVLARKRARVEKDTVD